MIQGRIVAVPRSRNSETPASCGNRTGGVADWLGVSVSIVPTQPPASPPARRFHIADGSIDGMPIVYDGPTPRHLRHSLEQVAPPEWNVRYLYVLTGPMGCIYIGQTYNPGGRMVRHRDRSRFWNFVTDIRVYRHTYEGIWPSVDGEIVDKERQAITDLVPICNLDRPLSEADRGAPWEDDLKRLNLRASMRALQVLGGA